MDTLSKKRKTIILINNFDVVNQKADTLITLLGKPNNFAGRSESIPQEQNFKIIVIDHYWYYLTTCGKDKGGKTLFFTVLNGYITDIGIIKK